MIRGSQNPFSCSPVIVSEASGVIALGTVSRVGNVFTFSIAYKWRINGVVYQNTSPFPITIPTATDGYNRTDIAFLNSSNQIERIQGAESASIALTPIAPLDSIIIAYWNISGATVSDATKDQNGRVFIFKHLVVYKIAENTVDGTLEIGDYCQGFVQGEFINANYLGGDATLLASFDI